MGSFLQQAGKQAMDVKTFVKEAAGGNQLKYKAEAGKKHWLFFPFQTTTATDENGVETLVKSLYAITGSVHDWTDNSGKYKASVCAKGKIIKDDNGNILNDGSCPVCDRVTTAWNIYNYRFDQEVAACGKTGEELTKHMDKIKGQFADERKAKDARPYLYVLTVKFKLVNGNVPVINDADKLPEFELKVSKLSNSKAEKLENQLNNCGDTLAGSEILIEYPDSTDPRLVVSQSTTSPVFPDQRLVKIYGEALINKINAEASKFEFDGLEKSFMEWEGMTTTQSTEVTTQLFKKWDAYTEELKLNPNAKYLEYGGDAKTISNPALGVQSPGIGVTQPMNGEVKMPSMDINSVLGGADASKPVI